MLRALLVLCLVSTAAPGMAQEYQSKELADAARDWRRELIDSVPANKKQPALIAGWRRTADADYQAKRYAAAIDELTRAIANGADDGLVWLRLAQNELAAEDDHAMASAYNAYLKSTDPVERGVARIASATMTMLASASGSIHFHPSAISWSYLVRGSVPRSHT